MTDRPILFSGPMVRAILAGTKMQTRRIIKPQPKPYKGGCYKGNKPKHAAPYIDAYCGEKKTDKNPRGMSRNWCWWTEDDRMGPEIGRCSYGQPGDLLWVREKWSSGPYQSAPIFAADGCDRAGTEQGLPDDHCARWRPSIHMPRWASRITLEVTEVRVQRLQEISEEDAKAEGVKATDAAVVVERGKLRNGGTYRDAYACLWDEINGPGSWHLNPWVWSISFRKVKP